LTVSAMATHAPAISPSVLPGQRGPLAKGCAAAFVATWVTLLLLTTSHAEALKGITKIVSGSGHSCVLLADQTVQCWGGNEQGQLGDGGSDNQPLPVPVAGLGSVIDVSAGGIHTCAVLADGSARCWGYGYQRQLGNPAYTGPARTPVPVIGLTNATGLSAAYSQTCALRGDGSVWCWGTAGFVGNSVATPIEGVTSAIAVAAGVDHGCALTTAGNVMCWGGNRSGQLGDGTTNTRTVAALVPGINDAIAVGAGDQTSCALRRNGTVYCWGSGSQGQLGFVGADSTSPIAVPSINDASALAVGFAHACVLRSGGKATCWGASGSGATGVLQVVPTPPTEVAGISGATAIAASGGQSSPGRTCVVRADSSAACWGQGPLGNGVLQTDSPVRLPVAGATDAQSIAAGNRHTCIVQSTGRVLCWGENTWGQLGDGSTVNRALPTAVVGLPAMTAVAPADTHSCGLAVDASVWCWGDNGRKQLGNNRTTGVQPPSRVEGLANVMSVSTGTWHSCALLHSDEVYCWGRGENGELGTGATADSHVPIRINGLSGVRSISASFTSTCALLVNGTVKCWGYDSYGSLGVPDLAYSTSPMPVQVTGVNSAESLEAGPIHACVKLRGGAVFCWGYDGSGQRGGAHLDGNLAVPVNDVNGATAITAASQHSCALFGDSRMKCWGLNEDGQLGVGSFDSVYGARDVAAVSGVIAMAAGGRHTCVIHEGNDVWCWGDNAFGQLGNGRMDIYTEPQTVAKAVAQRTMTEFRYVPLNYYFMTSRDNEKAALRAIPGWQETSFSFPVFEASDGQSAGITRFYFDRIARAGTRGTHFYTLLDLETSLLRAQNPGNQNLPMKPQDEGVDSYAYPPLVEGIGGFCSNGLRPVYRAFRGNQRFPDDPNHRFTVSVSTYNSLLTAGWTPEGVKFCVP